MFYELGVLSTQVLNGADFLTGALLTWLGFDGFLLVQAGLLLLLLWALVVLRRRQRFSLVSLIPTILESTLYALTMGSLISLVMVDLLEIDPRLSLDAVNVAASQLETVNVFTQIVLAVGAGVYEEVVFRLLLLGGMMFLLMRALLMRRWSAWVIATVISSLLFALAHHVGPFGEPLRWGAFVYRSLAGLTFGLIYTLRGLAVTVYTHTFYDLYVLLVLG